MSRFRRIVIPAALAVAAGLGIPVWRDARIAERWRLADPAACARALGEADARVRALAVEHFRAAVARARSGGPDAALAREALLRGVPDLVPALARHDPATESAILEGLSVLGADAALSIAALLTPASAAEQRAVAASCLVRLGVDAACVRTSLVRAAAFDVDARVRALALEALCRVQGVDPSPFASAGASGVVAALLHPDARVRAAAIELVAGMKEEGLQLVGDDPAGLVPWLLDAVPLEAPEFAGPAADLLARLPIETRDAVVDSLAGLNRRRKGNAARFLGTLDRVPRGTAPALAKACNDPEPAVRAFAVAAAARVVPRADETLPAVLRALKDTEARVRAAAETALAAYPVSASAVPELVRALLDREDRVRPLAAAALARAPRPPRGELGFLASARAGLVALLADAVPEVRAQAARVLGWPMPPAEGVVSALADALEMDLDPRVKLEAVHSLAGLQRFARPAIPSLHKALLLFGSDTDVGRAASALLDDLERRR